MKFATCFLIVSFAVCFVCCDPPAHIWGDVTQYNFIGTDDVKTGYTPHGITMRAVKFPKKVFSYSNRKFNTNDKVLMNICAYILVVNQTNFHYSWYQTLRLWISPIECKHCFWRNRSATCQPQSSLSTWISN